MDMQFDQYGQPREDKNIPIVIFSIDTQPDPVASEREGVPMFKEVEMVTIAFPADRQRTLVRPAKSVWKKVGGQPITYIDRFPDQYKRFKANQPQIVEGTPLSEAPFLTEATRATLRALSVYTVQQLASLQGQALKNIGPLGLQWQQQAVAYLETAKGAASTVAMAAELATLRQTVADLSASGADPRAKYAETSDDKLKDLIKERTGDAPRGNPSRATLIRMAIETEAGAKQAEAA